MTVNTTNITSGPYVGDNVNSEFSYTFRIEDETQLLVYETDLENVQTELTVNSDYTISNLGVDGGGIVTRSAGPLPTGYSWYIRSNYKNTQLTAFNSQGGFFPDVHEAAMDKLTFLIQQLADSVSRALRFSDTDSLIASTLLPTPDSSRLLGWNVSGTALENIDPSNYFGSGVLSTDFNRHIDSLLDLPSVDTSKIVDSQGCTVTGDQLGGSGYFVNIPSHGLSSSDNWTQVVIDSDWYWQKLITSGINFWSFGASVNADSTAAIQAAIDYAATFGSRTTVSGYGGKPCVEGEIFLKQGVVLKDAFINFDPTGNDVTCLNIGWEDGRGLVRVAGIVNVEVDVPTENTSTDLVGFNISHGARACFINQCRARMRTGPASADRGRIGFSMIGIRDDLVIAGGGINGAYQNSVYQCAAYAAKIAYRLDTEGYGETGFKAQMNGNTFESCSAYACTTSALYLGEGAQENIIDIRADTFISSIGEGTTVNVAEIRGSFNNVRIREEIGQRGDIQHTIAFEGDNPRYNTVEYSTQQIVTDDVAFNETGSAVGKNIAKNIGRPININGGDIFSVSGFDVGPDGTITTTNEVIFDCRCVLVRVAAKNLLTPATYTRFYFAKNGAIDTVQRLTWDNSDAPNTIKNLNTDPTASGTIDSRFIYDVGDYVRVRIDQDATASNTVGYTLYFKSLHRN